MADKLALIKRVMRAKTEDVMHSSAHAEAQNGGYFGAASAESFAARQSIEERRKFVRGYNNSRIMSGAAMSGPKAKTYVPTVKDYGAQRRALGSKSPAGGSLPAVGGSKPIVGGPPMPRR